MSHKTRGEASDFELDMIRILFRRECSALALEIHLRADVYTRPFCNKIRIRLSLERGNDLVRCGDIE